MKVNKKLLLYIIANIVLIAMMAAHTALFITQLGADSLKSEQKKFENSVEVIKHQATFYMESSSRAVREWGMLCDGKDWSYYEVADNIGKINSDDRITVMVLSADTLAGISDDEESPAQDADLQGINSLSRELSQFRSKALPGEVCITSTFSNIGTNERSIAFVTMIKARNDDGIVEDAYLMRVEPLTILEDNWFFSSNFPTVQVSIINSFGDYILQSPLMGNTNFYESLRSCNDITDSEMLNLMDNINSPDEKGHFIYSDTQGEKTLFGYSTRGHNGWVVIGAVPIKALNYTDVQWSLLISPLFTFFAILLISILFFQSLNRELRVSLKKLESANSAKTKFLSSMSHDIRTPMNAIVGLTTIAEQNIDDQARVKNCLGKISLASGHLLTLINDVLDISQVESGKFTINPVQFSLAESALDLVNIIYPQAEEKKLTCNIHLSNITQEYLLADKLRLNQIWLNILSNAVKYTPPGGQIDITLEEQAIPDDASSIMLFFTTKDTGTGMSPEFVQTIFEPFAREKDSRTDKIQGTGLGMAITKQIVDMLGGTISVRSELGKGSEFRVSLKLKRGYSVKYDRLPEGYNVLLVGDKDFSSSTRRFIKELGGSAECAESGDVMNHISGRRGSEFSLIIIDREMADIGCIETARNIRREFGESCPDIVISAFDWTDIENEARAAGVSEFITRPIFKTTLMDKFSQLVGGDIGRTNAESDSASLEELAGLRILIAEDNDINWEIISDIVQSHGMFADRAENGRECVRMLTEAEPGKYSLIFMDIQMPIMNGIDATREIRGLSDADRSMIPIIAMTANAFAEDVSNCIDAGMDAHIAKPINIKILLSEIRKYAGKKHQT